MDFDLFISHKSVDNDLATALAVGLESAGIRCYVDHLQSRNKWTDHVPVAKATPALVVLLTLNSCDDESDNIGNEVVAAKEARRMTIPVHTPDVGFGQGVLGGQFGTYAWIKWDPSEGTDDVVEEISRRLHSTRIANRSGADPAVASDPPAPIAPPTSVFTVHSRTPRIAVSLRRDVPGYQVRKAAVVRRFGPASGDRWALTPEKFEDFVKLIESGR